MLKESFINLRGVHSRAIHASSRSSLANKVTTLVTRNATSISAKIAYRAQFVVIWCTKSLICHPKTQSNGSNSVVLKQMKTTSKRAQLWQIITCQQAQLNKILQEALIDLQELDFLLRHRSNLEGLYRFRITDFHLDSHYCLSAVAVIGTLPNLKSSKMDS